MNSFRTMCAALALSAAGLTAAPALAQSSGIHAGSIEVPVNKSQVVSADRAIARAMVGNAEVADVLPISEQSVYVLGKKFGTTSLTLYDRANRVIAVMDVEVGPDVEGLRTQIAELVPGQPVEARISAGKLVLTGLVNDAGAANRAYQIAKAYGGEDVINMIQVGGSQQVMLEVKFAEINRQMGERLGVGGFGLSNDGTFRGAIGEGAGLDAENGLTLGAIVDSFGILSKAFSIGSLNIDATLDVLERKGLSKTLAEPTLVALSGERASFLAGGEFPIPVAQSSGGSGGGGNTITVEFKPFGVSLGFTPTVLSDKVISLVVEPEVSSIDSSASVTVNGLTVPGLQTRRASTTVELRDGESFAIAGLLRNDYQTTVRQLPLLGNIPILGALFRSSSFQKGETELLIVVTPRLVAPIRPEQVRLPTDRIADPKPTDVLTTGDSYRPVALPPQPGAVPIAAAGAASQPAAAATAAATTEGDGYAY
ncbi:type II and III secretion system protein family protein [Altererythrobacter sp. TH136]|uniref:type II and III secretion system protein family protein n=1 Tax=Altererythrobacter sp. TH136 TaxID=2067415 RepID=UPI0011652D79|nr:type II and III secretion system protein family protein [Altererythrobacter sp. TH136]QDM39624.1 type II and III secretion system protein family protein [Altererythrobacter sp. TH136]